MLDKPSIDEVALIRRLNSAYEQKIRAVSFLPLGADVNTAVYRAHLTEDRSLFLKLRRGSPNIAAVAIPMYLADQGMTQVIPTFRTQFGELWCDFEGWVATLHAFIEGRHGYQQIMDPAQWKEFGSALKYLHSLTYPQEIARDIPREDFSTRCCNDLNDFLLHIEREKFSDPDAGALVAFLSSKRNEIRRLIDKVEESVHQLKADNLAHILCHADIHCWNLLIDDRTQALYIVDWDTLIFAPKERDLMFVGAGLADSGYTPRQEAEMFFSGYGKTEIDQNAITYYRCARIVDDLNDFCRQLFLSQEGGDDRKQALKYVHGTFDAGGALARAMDSTSCDTGP